MSLQEYIEAMEAEAPGNSSPVYLFQAETHSTIPGDRRLLIKRLASFHEYYRNHTASQANAHSSYQARLGDAGLLCRDSDQGKSLGRG